VLFVVGAAVGGYFYWKYSQDLPDHAALANYEPPVMTRVHAADGSLLAEYARERRLIDARREVGEDTELILRLWTAKEAVLKTNLHTLRDILNQHYGDKGFYPPSLDALVDDGYIRDVPYDPMTKSSETWELIYEEGDPEFEPAETDLPEDGQPGVMDVYSGSDELSLDGEPYNEW